MKVITLSEAFLFEHNKIATTRINPVDDLFDFFSVQALHRRSRHS